MRAQGSLKWVPQWAGGDWKEAWVITNLIGGEVILLLLFPSLSRLDKRKKGSDPLEIFGMGRAMKGLQFKTENLPHKRARYLLFGY